MQNTVNLGQVFILDILAIFGGMPYYLLAIPLLCRDGWETADSGGNWKSGSWMWSSLRLQLLLLEKSGSLS